MDRGSGSDGTLHSLPRAVLHGALWLDRTSFGCSRCCSLGSAKTVSKRISTGDCQCPERCPEHFDRRRWPDKPDLSPPPIRLRSPFSTGVIHQRTERYRYDRYEYISLARLRNEMKGKKRPACVPSRRLGDSTVFNARRLRRFSCARQNDIEEGEE